MRKYEVPGASSRLFPLSQEYDEDGGGIIRGERRIVSSLSALVAQANRPNMGQIADFVVQAKPAHLCRRRHETVAKTTVVYCQVPWFDLFAS